MASSDDSHLLGRIYVGDGYGRRLEFAKRFKSLDTPLFTLSDDGGMTFSAAGKGIIVKSPDGNICRTIGIDDVGTIVATATSCN